MKQAVCRLSKREREELSAYLIQLRHNTPQVTRKTAKTMRFESPKWHAHALQEAESAVAGGKAKFADWKGAKKRLLREAAKLS